MGNFKNLELGNPSASSSCLQMNNEFAITSRQNYASEGTAVFHNGSNAKVDPLSFTYMPFSVSPFPSKNMHVTFQPHTQKIPQNYGNLMVDLNQQQLHNLQNPLIGPNSIIGGNVPSLYGQEFQCPERNVKGISCTGDNCEIASNVMNDSTHLNSVQVHETNRYFTPVRGNGGGGNEMIWHDGEADIGNIHGLHVNNLVGAKDSAGMLYQAPNSGGISNSNTDKVSPASHFGCPNTIDGSFLSLGIGGSMDTRSNLYPSNRKIIGELDGAASSQLNTCHVQQPAGTSLNAGQNLVGGFSSFQSNIRGFTSLGHHVGGWTLPNNNVGVRPSSNSHLNSSQFHILRPQAYVEHDFPTSSTWNLDIISDANAGYGSVDPCEGLVGGLGATSGPSNSSLSGWLDCQQTGSSGLESESILLSCTAAQPTFHQLNKHFKETLQNFPRESSMVASRMGFKGNPNKQDCSGPLFPASKSHVGHGVSENAQTPMRQHFQPAGTLSYANDITTLCGAESSQLSKNILEQVFKGNAAQASGNGIFPPRLGIQVNEHISAQAAGDALFPKSADIKATDPRAAYAADCGLYPKEIGFQMRCPQEAFPVRFPKALLDPTCSTGQGKSPAKGYGLSQAPGAFCGLSLKRSTARPPPADPRVQRRRIAHQRRNHQSGLIQPQSYPAIPFPIPAAFPHIKWQDSDGLSQPTGEKCMLCKRDLSFTPEGPVYQPTVPPAVAVLPCGHTFHDHCLQIIVPEDQSKNPPCIPCAISET
ncbi:uncharacterized protein LOC127790605 [Diospyros lotus]|uniref:uncharacterized protein LOC127790605 n=1 Tax=Diospyros lotus TaxID=55363 RepID=UPI002259C6E7|nr:uncharacterized protein LOC127790605 [Diospyros lotus]XP_052176141.1 uncharacterized protein LOC127790605 [Diospyros lotus]XP_052176142.1 uncharacterized protein LOC127790605 [Diospyros lotus]